MASKDASVASDYGSSVLVFSGDRLAKLIIELEDIPTYQPSGAELTLTPLGLNVAGVIYRMRGYDTTLSSFVFWSSPIVDMGGLDYTGPGPLANVVVRSINADCE